MPVDPSEQPLIDEMKQRELIIKQKKRATDAIFYRERRFRAVLLTVAGILASGIVALVIFELLRRTLDRVGWELPAIAVVALFAVVGVEMGRLILRSRFGHRLMAIRARSLRNRYKDDLNSGRRWQQFYYKDEDISAYVPQVLYFLESDQRFTTIDEALAFAKQNRHESPFLAAQATKDFERVASSTNLLVISTIDVTGRPASRLMRFVTSGRPGVWYVSTPPGRPKVRDFDQGKAAIVTLPAPDGGTINSNRLSIARAPFNLDKVSELFEEQIPGYLDGMTEGEIQNELVFEITMQSARVDTWLEHDEVQFFEPR